MVSVVAGTFGMTNVGAAVELSEPLVVIIALRTIITARLLASGATGDAYLTSGPVSDGFRLRNGMKRSVGRRAEVAWSRAEK